MYFFKCLKDIFWIFKKIYSFIIYFLSLLYIYSFIVVLINILMIIVLIFMFEYNKNLKFVIVKGYVVGYF